MNHLTNRRRSDGTLLDERHGISELCDGSSWRCITKRDRLSWLGLTRFRTTVREIKQEQVMFESSSESRKSWNGWQMTWQWFPDIWSNRWTRFGGCDGGLTWGNTYRQNWSRAECSRRYIFWDQRCQIGWLLKLEYPESNCSDFKANSVANRKPMQIRMNRCNVAEPRFLCNHSSKSILHMLKESEIWNGCASQERVAIIKSRANYCYSYGFWSLSSKRSTDVRKYRPKSQRIFTDGETQASSNQTSNKWIRGGCTTLAQNHQSNIIIMRSRANYTTSAALINHCYHKDKQTIQHLPHRNIQITHGYNKCDFCLVIVTQREN